MRLGALAALLAAVLATLRTLDAVLLRPSTLLAAFLGLVPLLFPWAIARLVFVPLGMVRAAEWLCRPPVWTWRRDPRGGAALAGAWALLRRRSADAETAAGLEDRLRAAPNGEAPSAPLRGAGIVASGLIAAWRGDVETARALLRSARHVDEKATPEEALRVASEWLVADAAARGDWQEVAALGREAHAGRTALLLSEIARRLLGRSDSAAPSRIWWLWALSSRRFGTLPLVRRAVQAEAVATRPYTDDAGHAAPRTDTETNQAPSWAAAGAREHALVAHATALALPPGKITSERIAALASVWNAALGDRAERRSLDERAARLGSASADTARARFRATLEEDLADLVRSAGVSLSAVRAMGGIGARAAERVRDGMLGEIELAATALRVRIDAEKDTSPIDEWRESLALRRTYERAVELGGDEVRRLAFSRAKNDVWSHAYRLSNRRSENTLAHAIYTWLLAEARAVGDTRSIEPLSNNVEATAVDDSLR